MLLIDRTRQAGETQKIAGNKIVTDLETTIGIKGKITWVFYYSLLLKGSGVCFFNVEVISFPFPRAWILKQGLNIIIYDFRAVLARKS